MEDLGVALERIDTGEPTRGVLTSTLSISVSVSVSSSSVSVADSPSVAEGVERSVISLALDTLRECDGSEDLVDFRDPLDSSVRGIRDARSFFWPYVRSISVYANIKIVSTSYDLILTGILKEYEETELRGVSSDAHKQHRVASNNEGKSIVSSIT